MLKMNNNIKSNILSEIFDARFAKLDQIIIQKTKNIENEEERESIKKAIIMKEMYIQGFIDGINLLIECKINNY